MCLLRIHAGNRGNGFIFKETNQKTDKNITEQHKHSLKRVVELLGHLRIFPWGDRVRGERTKGRWLRRILLFHPVLVYSGHWPKPRGSPPYGTVEVCFIASQYTDFNPKWSKVTRQGTMCLVMRTKYNIVILTADLINLLIKKFKTWLLPLLLQKYDRIWYFHR